MRRIHTSVLTALVAVTMAFAPAAHAASQVHKHGRLHGKQSVARASYARCAHPPC
jgi:hypothetical protein